MRPLRLLAPFDPGNGFPVMYHITSRVVEKRFIFNDRERARFLKLAKDFAFFSGFELVSWCLMSNHFHLLVRVPVQDVEVISDEEMVGRLERILSPVRMKKLIARLNGLCADTRKQILESFRKRIGHLPSYVKAVKQEFTQWFNHVNQREGTLWEGRYHSTLIEDTGGENPSASQNGAGEIARIVASYIDMNPVRANVEADPQNSTWSSYGAALGGDKVALRGLRILWGTAEEMNTDEEAASRSSGNDLRLLSIHRRWITRCQDADERIDPLADAGGARAMAGEATLRRGRPPSLSGLRRFRLLGSPEFQSRFGVSSVSLVV